MADRSDQSDIVIRASACSSYSSRTFTTSSGSPLGGAAAAAGRLPGQLGQVLLRAARQAFTQGLHVVFAISAAAVAGAAVLAAVQLRHLRPGAEPRGGSSGQEAAN